MKTSSPGAGFSNFDWLEETQTSQSFFYFSFTGMRIRATVVSIKSQIAKHSLVSFHLLDRDMALSLTVFLID